MTTETYNAIAAYRDQMLDMRQTSTALVITIFASHKSTINAIVNLARDDNMRVQKRITGRGTDNAEMRLTIS
jgi:hypothetical protein